MCTLYLDIRGVKMGSPPSREVAAEVPKLQHRKPTFPVRNGAGPPSLFSLLRADGGSSSGFVLVFGVHMAALSSCDEDCPRSEPLYHLCKQGFSSVAKNPFSLDSIDRQRRRRSCETVIDKEGEDHVRLWIDL
ncbi:hypothetical protein TorRG33x02_147250, partial [Trema orientale]